MSMTAIERGGVPVNRYVVGGAIEWLTTLLCVVPPLAVSGSVVRGANGLDDLARRGIVKLGIGRVPATLWDLPRGSDPDGHLRQSIREERDRGW